MARKVHVCIKIWELHLVAPPKCLKLVSTIPKTAHVKFQATSGSLSTTLWWYYRGSELGHCHDKVSLPYCKVLFVKDLGEVTTLSSWEPCANKKNLLFLSCITKMGQNFINFFSWVDIHGIYYIVKIYNQIWWSFFSRKHTVSN
jgi:hypothetical protein